MRRQSVYLGNGADAAFAWLHTDEAAPARDCVAVLCAPVGHEYTRAHRTLRHLADRLARVNTKRLLEVVVAEARDKLRFREDPRLSSDLRRLIDNYQRPITVFISQVEPGPCILLPGAPPPARP